MLQAWGRLRIGTTHPLGALALDPLLRLDSRLVRLLAIFRHDRPPPQRCPLQWRRLLCSQLPEQLWMWLPRSLAAASRLDLHQEVVVALPSRMEGSVVVSITMLRTANSQSARALRVVLLARASALRPTCSHGL